MFYRFTLLSFALSTLLLLSSCSDDDTTGPGPSPPVANAGAAQEANPGNEVVLDGSASVGDELSYHWRQLSGTEVALTDSTAAATTFTASDEFGLLSFELTVTDSRNDTDTDATVVAIMAEGNRPPIAEAGSDQTVGLGVSVQLSGSGTDGDGDDLTFSWRQYAGEPSDIALSPSSSIDRPTLTSPLAPTVLSFELRVDDGRGGVARDSTDVVVQVDPTPGLPTLWVLSTRGPNIGGWGLATLPLPEANREPDWLIEGAATQLDLGSTDIAVDAKGAVLASIAPSSKLGKITSYQPVEGTANLTPDRVVEGPSTLLRKPAALALDRGGDVLYVVDEEGVLVFNGVSTESFDGDVAPSRALLAIGTRYDPIAADLGPGGRLYVADRNVDGGSVWVYDDAANGDGLTAPSRIITGASMVGLTDVFVDDDDRMYVAVQETRRIHVWDEASTVQPGQAPDRTISPLFGNAAVSALIVDVDNTGYVLDFRNDHLLKFNDIHSAEGGTVQDGLITANALRSPVSVFLAR